MKQKPKPIRKVAAELVYKTSKHTLEEMDAETALRYADEIYGQMRRADEVLREDEDENLRRFS